MSKKTKLITMSMISMFILLFMANSSMAAYLTFKETGLPTGLNWWVDTVIYHPNGGTTIYSTYSSTDTVTISLNDGQYTFWYPIIDVGDTRYSPAPMGLGPWYFSGSWAYDIKYQTLYKVSHIINPNEGGTIYHPGVGFGEIYHQESGSHGWYYKGDTWMIEATPNTGYRFSGWGSDPSIIIANPSSATTTATVNGPGTITANFVLEDSTPPTTADNSPIDWKNVNFDVTLSCTDNSGGSGCKDTKYSIDGGVVWNTGTLISITSDGDHTIQYYSTDNAGNAETTKTVHAKLDKTPPIITGSRNPSANTYGWNNGDVTVHFNCNDVLSGVASCTPDTIVSAEGTGQSISGIVGDAAGNTASITVGDINIDKTVPVVSVVRSPVANSYGWNNGPVTVTFTATDSLSGIDIPTEIVSMSLQGAGQSVTREFKDKAGNAATGYITGINIDLTKPTLNFGTAIPVPNAAGWNNADVSVPFTADDSLSGVESTSPSSSPLVLTSEGSAVIGTVIVTDKAGNSETFTSPTFKIDKTKPTITGSRTPLANSNGWNNADVTVAFTCSDLTSPIITCTEGTIISTEGTGQSATGIAIDQAGNSASTTVGNTNIDKTSPIITASASTLDGVFTSGTWINKDVTVSFSCSDDRSGVESCSGSVLISGEGAGQFATGSTTDRAGNTASTTFSGINIDKTPPVITLNGNNPEIVELGSPYMEVGATVTDNFDSSVVVTSTGTVNTNAIGTYTMTYLVTDKAGNSAVKTRTVDVIYKFTGFFQPVDNTPILNVVKPGGAVPIKFSLNGYQGLNIFMTGYPLSKKVDCATNVAIDDIEITETAGQSSLSYDDSTGQYKYVWKTDAGWTGTCRQLTIKLNDGTEHIGNFKFK